MPVADECITSFADKDYIDMRRAGSILGVSWQTVMRLTVSGMLEIIEYRRKYARKKVRYQSIVEFCDRLRNMYNIPDRRPPLVPPLRHRDEDLLPFPLRITMPSEEATAALGLGDDALRKLIANCCFEAYQIVPGRSQWRISRLSFCEYLEALRNGPRPRGPGSRITPYREFSV